MTSKALIREGAESCRRPGRSGGKILEGVYIKRICESDQPKTVLASYEQDIEPTEISGSKGEDSQV